MGNHTVLYLDDYDTSRLGFYVESYDGPGSSAPLEERAVSVLGRLGRVLVSASPTARARFLTIDGTLIGSTVATARTNLDTLRGRLTRGTLECRFADQPERVYRARMRDASGVHYAPSVLTPASRVRLELECLDAVCHDRMPVLVGFGVSPIPCPLGTAASAPILHLMGSATDPVVQYRRVDGTVVGQLDFTGVDLGSNDFLTIDTDAATITRTTAGTTINAIAQLAAGRMFSLNPWDGDEVAGDWGTLEVSSGSGLAIYWKAYS